MIANSIKLSKLISVTSKLSAQIRRSTLWRERLLFWSRILSALMWTSMTSREPTIDQLSFRNSCWDKKIKRLFALKIRPFTCVSLRLVIVRLSSRTSTWERISREFVTPTTLFLIVTTTWNLSSSLSASTPSYLLLKTESSRENLINLSRQMISWEETLTEKTRYSKLDNRLMMLSRNRSLIWFRDLLEEQDPLPNTRAKVQVTAMDSNSSLILNISQPMLRPRMFITLPLLADLTSEMCSIRGRTSNTLPQNRTTTTWILLSWARAISERASSLEALLSEEGN